MTDQTNAAVEGEPAIVEPDPFLVSYEIELDEGAIQHEIFKRLEAQKVNGEIKGFRRDHQPISGVIKKYGIDFVSEVLKDLIVKRINEVAAERGDEVAGGVSTKSLWSIWDRPLRYRYRVEYELYPNVAPLRGLDRLQYRPRSTTTIDVSVVDAYIEGLRREKSPWKSVERAATHGDSLVVSFDGTIDEQPFPGGTAENVRVALGGGGMLPDFEAPLVGARSGDNLSFYVRFPDDYKTQVLGGKTARFAVTVRDVQEHELLPLDFAFFERCGMPGTREEFRDKCIENLRKQHAEQDEHDADNDILSQFMGFNVTKLPKCLVGEHVGALMQEQGAREGIPAKDVEVTREMVSTAFFRARVGVLVRALQMHEGLELHPDKPAHGQVIAWLIARAVRNAPVTIDA